MKPAKEMIEEARVIAFAAAGQVCNNEDAKCVETLVEKLVYAALAAAQERGRMEERAKIDEERGYIVDENGNKGWIVP